MPKLEMGTIDTDKIPADTHERYTMLLIYNERKYWWIMFFTGGALFFLSTIL